MAIGFRRIVKLFENGNVCVTGLRGTGKDMLMSNVCYRRGIPYVSNIDYGGLWQEYSYKGLLDMNGNTFRNFIEGDVIPYKFPFCDGTDIYLSDCGVYFPAQECSYLDKNYKGIPVFMALSRHLGGCNVHLNVQNLERCYRKLHEQSDTFIRTEWCKVIFGYVIQRVTVYDRGQSCQDRVPECPYRVPLFAPRQSKELYRMKIIDYGIAYGNVRSYILIYKNRSDYDTRHFKSLLGGDLHVK